MEEAEGFTAGGVEEHLFCRVLVRDVGNRGWGKGNLWLEEHCFEEHEGLVFVFVDERAEGETYFQRY